MVQVAWAATRTKGTYFADKYRRLAARRGRKRALICIARKILVIIYLMWKHGNPYRELGYDYLANLNKAKSVKYYRRKLEELGCTVELHEAA